MLSGNTFSSFARCFSPLFLSAVSVCAVIVTAVISVNSAVTQKVSLYTGEKYAPYVLLAFCTAAECAFAFLYAVGKRGYNLFLWRRVNGKTKPVFKADRALSTFRFLISRIMKFLFTLAWGFLFLLPFSSSAFGLLYLLSKNGIERNIALAWGVGTAVLLVIGLFFTFIVAQRYAAWYYFLCEPDMKIVPALQKSIEATEGKCAAVFFFKFSMLPWIVPCALVFPAIYIIPYYSLSVSLMIRGLERKTVEPVQTEKPIIFKKLEAQG